MTVENIGDYADCAGLFFEADIYDASNDAWVTDHRYQWDEYTHTMYLPTADCWGGEYILYVYYRAEGYDDAKTFAILSVRGVGEGCVLDLENDDLLTNEPLFFSAFAPDAENIHIRVYRHGWDDEGNPWQWDYSNDDGWNQFFASGWRYDEPGDYAVEATFALEGGWNQTVTREFTVSAPYGQLDDVILTVNSTFNPDGGLTFTVEGDENTERYNVWIHDLTDGDIHVFGRDYVSAGTYTAWPWEFDRYPEWNHAYQVHADALAVGYESTRADAFVVATDTE